MQHPLFPVLALSFLACAAYVGWRLYNTSFMWQSWIYAVGVLAVFWFSVSGGMFNIIRGMPLVGLDPNTRQVRLLCPCASASSLSLTMLLGARAVLLDFPVSTLCLALHNTTFLCCMNTHPTLQQATFCPIQLLYRVTMVPNKWKHHCRQYSNP